MDKRIGKRTETKTEWPETTISGAFPYRKPCTTVSFGQGYFAVLDVFIKPDKANGLILELQAIVNSETKPKAAKPKLETNEEIED